MNITVFEKLYEQELLAKSDLDKIKTFETKQPVSIHWDLRTLLYLGILLLTTGIGIIVYKNIDSIGHDVIIGAIALSCTACFFYCIKKSKGYTNKKVQSPNVLFDYVVLLGCLLLLTLIGYVQFQYNAFGNRWGLAIFTPMVLLFITAYYFDHLGVLSLAITNLAAWIGITVTPMQILSENDFNSDRIIYSAIILGAGLVVFSFATIKRNIKAHFAFTYKNFGAHLLFITTLAAMFEFYDIYLLWFLLLAAIGFFFYKNALKENSFYFLVITFLYGYIGISFVVLNFLWLAGGGIGLVYLGLIYVIGSGIGLIKLMMHYNKIFKKNVSI